MTAERAGPSRAGMVLAIALGAARAAPHRGLSEFYTHLLVLMLSFAIFAMILDILTGYGGLPSLPRGVLRPRSLWGRHRNGEARPAVVAGGTRRPDRICIIRRRVRPHRLEDQGTLFPAYHPGARPAAVGRGQSLGIHDRRLQRVAGHPSAGGMAAVQGISIMWRWLFWWCSPPWSGLSIAVRARAARIERQREPSGGAGYHGLAVTNTWPSSSPECSPLPPEQ